MDRTDNISTFEKVILYIWKSILVLQDQQHEQSYMWQLFKIF